MEVADPEAAGSEQEGRLEGEGEGVEGLAGEVGCAADQASARIGQTSASNSDASDHRSGIDPAEPEDGDSAAGQPDADPDVLIGHPPPPEIDLALVAWLLHAPIDPKASLAPHEQTSLDRLDTAIGSAPALKALLPRAPQVVPQLLSALRADNVSTVALAQRMERDAVLRVDVLRRANSASYGVTSEITDLSQAIAVLGTSELRALIARHALRPIFDAPPGSLAAEIAPRIASLGDRKAHLCNAVASSVGQDGFDAYLCGLVHDIGWSAVARVLDREPQRLHAPISLQFAAELARRRDRLFGLIARPWSLTDGVTGLATVLSEPTPTEPLPALGIVLRWGNALAALPLVPRSVAAQVPRLPRKVAVAMRGLPALPG